MSSEDINTGNFGPALNIPSEKKDRKKRKKERKKGKTPD